MSLRYQEFGLNIDFEISRVEISRADYICYHFMSSGGGIGDPCSTSNSASCSTGNSECSPTTSQCACINGYVYVSATQTCDQRKFKGGALLEILYRLIL